MENNITNPGECKIKDCSYFKKNEKIVKFLNNLYLSDMNDEEMWKTLYELENEIIDDNKSHDKLHEKIQSHMTFINLFILLQIDPRYNNRIGSMIKLSQSYINKNFKLKDSFDNSKFKSNWKLMIKDMKLKLKTPQMPKFLTLCAKNYLKNKLKIQNNLINTDSLYNSNFCKIIQAYDFNKEIELNEFGINIKIIEYIVEIMIISNIDLIKLNYKEFYNSNLFSLLIFLNQNKNLEELVSNNKNDNNLDIVEINSLQITKLLTLLQIELSSNNITLNNVIMFLSLYFQNMINIVIMNNVPDSLNQEPMIKIIRVSHSDILFNNLPLFLSYIILSNLISLIDREFKYTIIPIFSRCQSCLYKSFPILEDNGPKNKLKREMNFENIHKLINSSSNKTLLELYSTLTANIDIKSNFSNVQDITHGVMGLLGSFVPKKFTSTIGAMNKFKDSLTVKKNDINISSIKLYPYKEIKWALLPHIYICISGFTSELDQENIEWSNFIEGLADTSDFYLYKWESENAYKVGIEVLQTAKNLYTEYMNSNGVMIDKIDNYRKNNLFLKAKNNSKFYGRLLAYILASRKIFGNRPISLVGFSLGAQVLKYCLKELNKISALSVLSGDNSINNLINNVIFIAGATTFNKIEKWNEYFKLPKGKIINIYSKHDTVLNYLFKLSSDKSAIGVNELIFSQTLNNFVNIDYTYMEMGHSEYRHFLHIIYNRLKYEHGII